MKRLLFGLICTAVLSTSVSAHVLDEYVQKAQIDVAPTGTNIELNLTPGVEVFHQVFALIDLDRDGQISSSEEQDYAQRVLHDVEFVFDGQQIFLRLKGLQFSTMSELKEGIGAIRLDLSTEARLSDGDHKLYFRNNHLPDLSVYLANALVPTNEQFKVTGQERDALQRQLEVTFRVTAPGNPVTNAADNHLLSTFMPAVFLRVLPVWCWWTFGLLFIAFVVLRVRKRALAARIH